MIRFKSAFILLFILLSLAASAQMKNGGTTLYGNEWIEDGSTYFKIKIVQDGIFKLGYQTLKNSGWNEDITGAKLHLYHNGQECPITLSTEGAWNTGDFLTFRGYKNKSDLDVYLYPAGQDDIVNPEASLYTDTAVYFLTINNNPTGRRTEIIINDTTSHSNREKFLIAKNVYSWDSKVMDIYDYISIQGGGYTTLSKSKFIPGKGVVNSTANAPVQFKLDNFQADAVFLPKIQYRGTTNYGNVGLNLAHDIKVNLNGTEISSIFTQSLQHKYIKHEFIDQPHLITDANNKLEFVPSHNLDLFYLGFLQIDYPYLLLNNNKKDVKFILENPESKNYLVFQQDAGGFESPYLTDSTGQWRMTGIRVGNEIKFNLGAPYNKGNIYFTSDESIIEINRVEQKVLHTFNGLDKNFTIISAERFIEDPGNNIQAYLAYKASPSGGNYRIGAIAIEDLYDAYAYGNLYNPLAIKNFINYQFKISSEEKYYFLVGKAYAYTDLRQPGQLANALQNGSYTVPTMGDVGSDNMLASESFDKIDMVSSIGRLPIYSLKSLDTYLKKVQRRDEAYTLENKSELNSWMKNVIQLNGGKTGQSDESSINQIQKSTAEIFINNKFAGYNTIYKKETDEPIGDLVDDYYRKVNEGVSIVDYFGHGAIANLEIPVERSGDYHNSPRLPILIIKGCNAGNMNTPAFSVTEKVLIGTGFEESGFAAVLASAGKATIGNLGVIGTNFYNLLGGELYGQPLGLISQHALSNPNVAFSMEAFQQIYAGDPTLVIPSLPGPDYTVDSKSIQLTPAALSSQDKKLEFSFDIVNLASNPTVDTLSYVIYYESNEKIIVDSLHGELIKPASKEKINVEFQIPTNSGGLNKIYIKLDPTNRIKEEILPMAEMNNEYFDSKGEKGYSFFIKSAQLTPVYPLEFSIVDTSTGKLYAFSSELDETEYTYKFSLDTTDYFNSPLLRNYTLTSHPGHLEVDPVITYLENTVYYWRVSRDSISPNKPAVSATSSFTYIPGEEGFNQMHNGQFRKNFNNLLEVNGGGNNIQFGKRSFFFSYTNGLTAPANINYLGGYRETIYLRAMQANKYLYDKEGSSLMVMWYTQDSMFHFYPPGYMEYGASVVSNSIGTNYMYFEAQKRESRIALVNFIENVIKPEDAFVFGTINRADSTNLSVEDWASDSIYNNGKNIFNVLEKYGAQQVRQISREQIPYTVILDKTKGLLAEKLSLNKEEHTIQHYFLTNSDFGSTTQVFGPAASWGKLIVALKDSILNTDNLTITIIGLHHTSILLNKKIELQYSKLLPQLDYNLSEFDATIYPFLQVKLSFNGPLSYQGKFDGIKTFKLIGTELPEAALIANHTLPTQDTIPQGEQIVLQVTGKNIGRYDMDSMLVSYTLSYENNDQLTQKTRYGILKKRSTDLYSIDLDTRGVSGPTQLLIEMNPNEDQPEATHINNLIFRKIFVIGDKQNPLVDVTFDGDHIIDGDIVSSRPYIKINIRDENTFFALDDSSLFKLIVTTPDDSTYTVLMNDPTVHFIPADKTKLDQSNVAMIEYRPLFFKDGDYQLEVRARDVLGNSSGQYDYKKIFKIILKKSISNLFNYPNPFSNATRFAYTLTGNELPTYYKIQIMTVSGKVVREITQSELGPLRIGKHLTDYVWNGTDQFGDKLANGVYLYRLKMSDQQRKSYDKYELSVDNNNYFTGEWGKLVIIR